MPLISCSRQRQIQLEHRKSEQPRKHRITNIVGLNMNNDPMKNIINELQSSDRIRQKKIMREIVRTNNEGGIAILLGLLPGPDAEFRAAAAAALECIQRQ